MAEHHERREREKPEIELRLNASERSPQREPGACNDATGAGTMDVHACTHPMIHLTAHVTGHDSTHQIAIPA